MLRGCVWLCVLVLGCSAGPEAVPVRAGAARPSRPSPVVVQPGDVAITDVSVVPMSSDGVLAHHTVVIRGDRIAAVAPSAAVAVPAGVTVIDGAGKWLMPGLADMHVHTWSEGDLTMFLAAGVTTIRNMWGVPEHVAWRSQIARGERLGPTIVTSGSLIDGDPPDWAGSVVLVDPAEADALVAQQKAAGYDFLKSVSQLTPAAYQALAAAAARHGMVLAGHVPAAVGLEGVLAAHQRSVEHLDGWLEALVPPGVKLPPAGDSEARTRAILAGLDRSRLPGLIERTIAAGTWNCPTLVTLDRIAAFDDVPALRRRVGWLDKAPSPAVAGWTRDVVLPSGYSDEDFATLRAARAELARIFVALAAANAPFLVGTDTGVPFVIPGAALHDEIELMIAAGVPRARVLRAATADAWRYLGQPHEAGVIAAGARADLVLLSTDPLTTPLPPIPDGVMARGRWLPRAELESRLAEVVKRNAPPADRWAGAPPLAIEGKPLHQAHYDISIHGSQVGQERVAIGVAGGGRIIVGQSTDPGNDVETSYKLGPDAVAVSTTYHTMTVALAGKIAAGKLVVTGNDLTGKPVSRSSPVPAGAFLSAPGLGGALALAGKLSGMKPGTRRTVTALELDAYPAIAIASTRYEVARKPDAGGHRVFAFKATQGEAPLEGELVLDAAGLVVSQTLGAPRHTSTVRRP